MIARRPSRSGAPRGEAGPRVVLIDNYDSFTYNVAQRLSVLGADVSVFLNDEISVDEIAELDPEFLVVSPGPGGPSGTGICADAFQRFRGEIPILGVCLGHQLIASVLGGTVAPGEPIHGKPWPIYHSGEGIFAGLPSPFVAARYHSLAVHDLPVPLRALAWSEDRTLMGFGTPGEATWGVQFHPESFMTPQGDQLLANFLRGEKLSAAGQPSVLGEFGLRGMQRTRGSSVRGRGD